MESMEWKNLLWAKQRGAGIITFNRPQALNALNPELMAELDRLLNLVEADRELRGLILTGAGEKAFIAGADIKAMSAMNPRQANEFAEMGHRILDRFGQLPIPVIAAVNGFALGGGCEVALACDLIFASELAKFSQPEVNLGIIPGFGGTQRLARRIGIAKAKELIFSADMIDASEALALGLANRVLPPADLMENCLKFIEKIATKGPFAIRQAKLAIEKGIDLDLATANLIERQAFAVCFATDDQKEGTRAFMEKRAAQFKNQ